MKAFRVSVRAEDEDEATAILWEAGTTGIEVQSGPNSEVTLLSYFENDTTAAELEQLFRSFGTARITTEAVPKVDWLARFREGFRGFRAGSFEVLPIWELGARDPRGPNLLVVDPGRAFGTGTHETTRLCLAAVEEALKKRPASRVLDVGTGTGLLAVAARKRGAGQVTGVDNDPKAVTCARAHALLNEVRVDLVLGDGGRPFRPASFDLVLANLMAPLLIARRSELTGLLADHASLVLSGLLETDVAEVASAFSPLGEPSLRIDGEWAALVFEHARSSGRPR